MQLGLNPKRYGYIHEHQKQIGSRLIPAHCGAEQTARASEDLANLAAELQQMVAQFKA